MSGPEERSAADREAARLERERRRAERRNSDALAARAAIDADPTPDDAGAKPEPKAFDHRREADAFGGEADVSGDEMDVSGDEADVSGDEADVSGDEADEFGDEADGFGDDADVFGDGADALEDEPAGDALPDELPSGTKRVAGARRVRLRGERPDRGRRDPAGRARIRRRSSWRGRIAAVLVLGLAAAFIWFLIELFQPFHGSPHGSIKVTIPAHSSLGQIGDLLERDGVISSSFFFEARATLAGERGDLRSGTYRMQLGMSYGSVLKLLTTAPKPAKVTDVTIIEGKTRREIDALLRSEGIRGSYLAQTRRSRLLNPRQYGAPRSTPTLEGFLFPSTYQLREPIKISALVDDQLKTFKAKFRKVNLRFARSKHLTPYDVLTIASMIEAETPTAHDRPLVSSVIYNRLRDQMPLQIDATSRYLTGDYTHSLTKSELRSSSPYNTRIHKGLPPTPIGNPGMAAIRAAANPAHTDYLYFVVKPGACNQAFTSSFVQFEKLEQQYQLARARRGGRSPSGC